MKLRLLFLVAGLVAGTRAADCVGVALTAIPSCAQSCFLNGAPSVGCAGTDFTCQCQQEARLYAAVEGCVSTGCPSASYQAVIDGASSVCKCAIPAGSTMGSGTVVSGIGGSNTALGPAPTTGVTKIPATTTSSSGGGSGGNSGGGTTGSGAGGSGNGTPIPTPTIPSITIATGASSWAERSSTLRFGILGSLVPTAILAALLL